MLDHRGTASLLAAPSARGPPGAGVRVDRRETRPNVSPILGTRPAGARAVGSGALRPSVVVAGADAGTTWAWLWPA